MSDDGKVQASTTAPSSTRPKHAAGSLSLDDQKLRNLGRWISCVCMVTFDLEQGQTLEHCYPPGQLCSEDGISVANLAFPDTNTSSLGVTEQVFCFRFRTQRAAQRTSAASSNGVVDPPSSQAPSDVASFSVSRSSDGDHSDGALAVGTPSTPPKILRQGSKLHLQYAHSVEPAESPMRPRISVADTEEAGLSEVISNSTPKPVRGSGKHVRRPSVMEFETAPYLFGYAFFRQKKDPSISRGYFQKSVVLVSHLPFVELFERVVSIVGPLYFDFGASCVEAACHNIANWPAPQPGLALELPLMGEVIDFHVPHFVPSLNSGQHPNSDTPLGSHPLAYSRLDPEPAVNIDGDVIPTAVSDGAELGADGLAGVAGALSLSELLRAMHQGTPGWFQGVNVYEQFSHMLPTLWYLWELVLTGEPILVVGKTPALCSRAVLSLASLISPMEFGGDYRPYFTIYDPDFRYYSSLQDVGPDSLPSCILGVTNPLFLKVFEKFPHVLVLHSPEELNPSAGVGDDSARSEDADDPPTVGTPSNAGLGPLSSARGRTPAGTGATPSKQAHALSPRIVKRSAAGAMSALASSNPTKAGATLYSKGTPTVFPDKLVLRQLFKPARPEPIKPSAPLSRFASEPASSAPSASPVANSNGQSNGATSGTDADAVASLRSDTDSNGPSSALSAPALAARSRSSEETKESRPAPVSGAGTERLSTRKNETNGGPSLDQSSAINNALLRRTFRQMTERILQPFEKCFAPDPSTVAPGAASILQELEGSLLRTVAVRARSSDAPPPQNAVAAAAAVAAAISGNSSPTSAVWNPYLELPVLPRFSEEAFLKDIKKVLATSDLSWFPAAGIKGRRKQRLLSIYQRLFTSPNFYPWFHKRREEAQQRIDRTVELGVKRVYQAKNAAMSQFLDGLRLSQAVKMYQNAMTLLAKATSRPGAVDRELCDAVRSHMALMENALPKQVLSPVAASFSEHLRASNGRFAWQTSVRPAAGASNNPAASTSSATAPRTPSRFTLSASTSYSELRSTLAGFQAVQQSGVIAPNSSSASRPGMNVTIVPTKGAAASGDAADGSDSILSVERSELEVSIIQDHFK